MTIHRKGLDAFRISEKRFWTNGRKELGSRGREQKDLGTLKRRLAPFNAKRYGISFYDLPEKVGKTSTS